MAVSWFYHRVRLVEVRWDYRGIIWDDIGINKGNYIQLRRGIDIRQFTEVKYRGKELKMAIFRIFHRGKLVEIRWKIRFIKFSYVLLRRGIEIRLVTEARIKEMSTDVPTYVNSNLLVMWLRKITLFVLTITIVYLCLFIEGDPNVCV